MVTQRRRLMLVVVGALGLVVATSALAWACTWRANISLDPPRGEAGSNVTVHGSFFLEGEVDIYWDSVSSSRLLGTAEATGSAEEASFTKTVTIPEGVGGGDHTIVAQTSEPDSGGSNYQAQAVYTVDSSQESSDDPSQEQESSGDPSQESSESPSQESSESPSQESSGEPSQQTSGTTSQETSGSTSQETSGAGSEDRERTSEPNSVPAMGAGEEEQAGAPESSEQDSAGEPEPAPSAEERQSVGEPAPAEPAPAENRQQVGADAAAPAPSGGESPTAQADNAPASANQGAVESDSGETVFGGSVGASEDSEQAQAPEPADEGPEPVTAPSEEQSAGFSIPEAMRSGSADAAEGEAPAAGSAGGDLWSGLESGETPSLTDEALADDESVSRTDGLPGALTAGVALLGLGLVTLFAGLGTAAVRRRQPAVARTRSRSQER